MFIFKNIASEPLENCEFVDPQCSSWRLPYQIQNNLDYLQIKMFKVNPQRNRHIFFPTVCDLPKINIPHIIHQRFGHVYIDRLKRMSRIGLLEDLPTNLPDLEYPWTICLFAKANKISISPIIDVSKFSPRFILQMDFIFSTLKASVHLPLLLWIYVQLLHTPLDLYP